jgi:tetratricopeptide (TPR) repeat protein
MKRITGILLMLSFAGTLFAKPPSDVMLRARAALAEGDYPKASAAILATPAGERSPEMLLALGESYYRSGDYAAAISQFDAADAGNNLPEARLYAARAYAMMKQPAQATEKLQAYLSQRDKLPESDLWLDPALEQIENSKEWRALWQKEWYNAAERKAAEASSLLKRKKYAEALTSLDESLKKNESAAPLWMLRARTYTAMEQYAPAMESYRKALSLRSNRPAYYREAASAAVAAKQYAVALDYLNQALRLDPNHLDDYLQRASVYRELKQYDAARADLDFYFTYLPADAKALFQLGEAETEAGRPNAGIEYFSQLIDKDKSSPEYYTARAKAYILTARYQQANDDLAQALDLNPRSAEAWLNKGIALHEQQDDKGARYCWEKALRYGNKEAASYLFKLGDRN